MRSTHDVQAKVARDAAKGALREKGGLFQPTEAMLSQAHIFWAHVPQCRCWVAVSPDDTYHIILKPTAAYANRLVRKGWQVVELKR
jgi:hypothetical protein